ncbi:MAG: HEPN domain-containing protein [Phycisphaerales bacterium]
MSLESFDQYLAFSERAVRAKDDLPDLVDALEFENALVNLGVVLIYAHMEQCFRRSIESKCNCCEDLEVRSFALSVKDEKTGKIGMGEVKGTLKKFGKNCQDRFKRDLEASGLRDSWDSVMNQRAQVAHYGEPASITLRELREYYEGVRKVLGLICNALGLSATDVGAISSLIVLPEPPVDPQGAPNAAIRPDEPLQPSGNISN